MPILFFIVFLRKIGKGKHYISVYLVFFNQIYVNEKEIESLDIVIDYLYKDKSLIEVEGVFAASDGETLKILDTVDTFKQIAPKIEAFIKSCYVIYPKVAKLYTTGEGL